MGSNSNVNDLILTLFNGKVADLGKQIDKMETEVKEFREVKLELEKIKLQNTQLKAVFDGLKRQLELSDKTDLAGLVEDLVKRVKDGEHQFEGLVSAWNELADSTKALE